MNRHINRCVRYFVRKFESTGLEQELNHSGPDGLLEHGVKLCQPLSDAYRSWCSDSKNAPDEGFWGHWPMSHPEMPLNRKPKA